MALAAGMKGENAVALQTTVLVTVVLTVVVFGGTIGRMIEILGIRTGVEEDDDESTDDEGEGDVESYRSRKRRSVSSSVKFTTQQQQQQSPGGGGGGHDDELKYRDRAPVASDSEESDSDVLPANTSTTSTAAEGDLTRVWRDGQWFTVLDERYLLPVFSNATASRRQASKKAQRTTLRSSTSVLALDDYADSSPPPSSEYTGSFGDILSSLVGPAGIHRREPEVEEEGLVRPTSRASGSTTPGAGKRNSLSMGGNGGGGHE